MRVLAASFGDPGAADRALDALRHRYGLRSGDASIAPLGDDAASGARTVLAGHFRDERVDEIREVIAEYGGEVLSDVDESWTHPYAGESSSAAGSDPGLA